MVTAIIYSPKCLEHKTGNQHPERPQRLMAIVNGIEKSGLLNNNNIKVVRPEPASIEDLKLVHESEYIERVKSICESGGGLLDEETQVSRESFEAARAAAGGALEAVRGVISGEFANAFAIVRPPGHHAGPARSEGFCIFNNAAIAAKYLIRDWGLKRIIILDIDAHHGNGTQELFYDDSSVLYISIHEEPIEFPRTGFIWEVGEGEGRGYTINIPLPYGSGDPSFWKSLKTIVLPIAAQYKPQFMLVSAGFDGYYRDYIADLSLSAYIYPRIFQLILDFAYRVCDGRMAAILEGGYNIWLLRRVVVACVAKMAGLTIKIKDKRPPINLLAQKEAEKVIRNVRRIQSRYWSL